MKCSWVKFKVGVSEVFNKCNEVEWSVIRWSVVKWSEGPSNEVSTIIIYIYIYIYCEVCCLYGYFFYHTLSYFFGFQFYTYVYGCMFCMVPFNFVNYVFLLLRLCILIVMFMYSYYIGYSVPLCCSMHCLCANVYCTTATGCQPNCN